MLQWFLTVWPVMTFVITALFKARTPEEYDAMVAAGWPKFALDIIKFCAVAGVDGAQLSDALGRIAQKTSKTATEEYLSKLPADIRATLPPLAAPPRIDSKEIPAVRSAAAPTVAVEPARELNVGDYIGGDDAK
jgi:hypothetical protein